MTLLPFFQWCEATAIGTAIRESPWAFATIESVHLVALALIGGAVLMLDMRLLGFGLRTQPIAEVASDAQRWLNSSLVVMVITGFALFLSEAVKCYYSSPFWLKMASLLIATVFTYTVRRRVAHARAGRVGLGWRRAVALVSLTLWFSVGASGRWIGFSG